MGHAVATKAVSGVNRFLMVDPSPMYKNRVQARNTPIFPNGTGGIVGYISLKEYAMMRNRRAESRSLLKQIRSVEKRVVSSAWIRNALDPDLTSIYSSSGCPVTAVVMITILPYK